LDGCPHDPDARPLDDAAEVVGPLAVAIADEDLMARQEPIDRIGQSPRLSFAKTPSGRTKRLILQLSGVVGSPRASAPASAHPGRRGLRAAPTRPEVPPIVRTVEGLTEGSKGRGGSPTENPVGAADGWRQGRGRSKASTSKQTSKASPMGGSRRGFRPLPVERTSEMVRLQAIPDSSRGPDRSTTGQVSMNGNGSARRLWNCLRDRHPGDMETYGRSGALDEEIVRAGTCAPVWTRYCLSGTSSCTNRFGAAETDGVS
jgi:hypothetical protein